MARRPTDLFVQGHGSIALLRPLTDVARDWLREHTSESAQWWCDALVVEPRYVTDIVRGAISAGLEVR